MKLVQSLVLPSIFAGAIALLSADTLHASINMVLDKSSFLSQIKPDYYLENFDSLPTNQGIATPKSFTSPGNAAYNYSVRAADLNNTTDFIVNWSGAPVAHGGPGKLVPAGQWDSLTLTFSGSGVYAIGGDLALIDSLWVPTTGTFNISFNGGAPISLPSTTSYTFMGFISDTPITSVTISQPSATSYNKYVAVDNLYVGAVPVPEAASLGFITLSALALLTRRRK